MNGEVTDPAATGRHEDLLPGSKEDLPVPRGVRVSLSSHRSVHVRKFPAAADSQPAVYVHGLFSDSTYWTELGYLLSERLEGHAVDLPGFGRSHSAPGYRHSLDAHAGALRRYIAASERGPVHLAGNSLGGVVTLLVAARWPGLVRTLTLMSPAMPIPAVRPRTALFAATPLLPPAPSPKRMVRLGGSFVFGDESRLTAARRRRFEAVFAEQRSLRTRSASLQSLASLGDAYLRPGRSSLWGLAGSVTVPTLVIWGGRDRIMPPSLAPRLADAMPDARLLILDDVGHLPYLEAPEPVARAMLALITEHDRRLPRNESSDSVGA